MGKWKSSILLFQILECQLEASREQGIYLSLPKWTGVRVSLCVVALRKPVLWNSRVAAGTRFSLRERESCVLTFPPPALCSPALHTAAAFLPFLPPPYGTRGYGSILAEWISKEVVIVNPSDVPPSAFLSVFFSVTVIAAVLSLIQRFRQMATFKDNPSCGAEPFTLSLETTRWLHCINRFTGSSPQRTANARETLKWSYSKQFRFTAQADNAAKESLRHTWGLRNA